jgi:RNase P/RNase MRP subunit p29
MSITSQSTDLVGCRVQILKSPDSTHTGITGIVRLETLNMIKILVPDGSEKMFEKKILLLRLCDSGTILDGARIKNIYSRSTLTSYEHKN